MSPAAVSALLATVPELIRAIRAAGSESQAEASARRILVDAAYEATRLELAARKNQ